MPVYWVKYNYTISSGTSGATYQDLFFQGFDLYKNSRLVSFSSATEPVSHDPLDLVTATPIAAVDEGYFDDDTKAMVFTGYKYLNEYVSLSDAYLVGSAPDPTVLTSPTLTTSPSIFASFNYEFDKAALTNPDKSKYYLSYEYSSYGWAQIGIPDGILFNDLPNFVDFNNLQAPQLEAIDNGAELYNSLEGNDNVSLPDASRYHLTTAQTWDPTQAFATGGGNDKVTGGNGNDYIVLGDGKDVVFGSPGVDIIHGGAGQDIFDYRDGRFANFGQFRAVKQQLIGGHSSFQTSSKSWNVIELPGSPDDYTFAVGYAGGDSFNSTTTAIVATGGDHLPAKLTINATGIEKVDFATSTYHQDVALTRGTVAAEMLELAAESYGVLRTLSHRAEPLAYESRTVSRISDDAQVRHWHALSAIELGMAAADFDPAAALTYSFSNGVYQAKDANSLTRFFSDVPEADAMVLTGNVKGVTTLAIAFRGTDQLADFSTYHNFRSYYNLFKPLVDSLQKYIADSANGIKQVLVSGHSLGAGALQYFMSQFKGANVKGYTAGSPGAEVDTSDSRILNFINDGDPVPLVPGATSSAAKAAVQAAVTNQLGASTGNAVGQLLQYIDPKERAGESVTIDNDVIYFYNTSFFSFDEHSARLYDQELQIISEFAFDSASPFSKSALAKALVGNTALTSSTRIAIAGVGGPATALPDGSGAIAPANNVHIKTGDAYVLGAPGSKIFWNTPSTSDVHIIDGGPGATATVVLPFFRTNNDIVNKGDHYEVSLTAPATGGIIGELYRVSKIVFGFGFGSEPLAGTARVKTAAASVTTDRYVLRLDGSATKVQSAAASQTTLTVDPTFDYVDTGAAKVTVTGSGKGDIIAIGTGASIVNESTGDNIIFVKDAASASNIVVKAGAGDNEVITGAGNDTLVGGAGTNTFSADGGTNHIDGNGGFATVVLTAAAAEYRFMSQTQANGSLAVVVTHLGSTGTDGIDVLTGVQNLRFTDGDFNLVVGTAGVDTLSCIGRGMMFGRGGDDTYFVDTVDDKVVEALGEGNDMVSSSVSYALQAGSEVETLQTSDAARTVAIDLTGNEFANRIIGSAGSNRIDGGGGADVLQGLGGNDFYSVDDVGDKVVEQANCGTDTVETTLNTYKLGTNVERVTFTGSGNFAGLGNALDNRLAGGAGDDRFVASAGADVYSGGSGTDSVDYRTSTTGAMLDFSTGSFGGAAAGNQFGSIEKFYGSDAAADTMFGGGTGRVSFSGYGGDDVLAGAGNIDQLNGGAGNDTLSGLAGADSLDGGAGDDTMTGGTGADLFVYSAAGFGRDTITDFEDGLDRFKVNSSVADAISDFTITGNGSANVTLSLIADPNQTIGVLGAAGANVTLTAKDFLFY